MDYLLSAFIGFMVGSFPTAYLLLKRTKKIDITKSGSGNVGAMNSYDVTGSKLIGITVFLIDAVKGVIPVIIVSFIYTGFAFAAVALIFAVFSHCFNPWLQLKGGRGLATAAGGLIPLFPFLALVWVLMWIILFFMKKDTHYSNIFATVLTLAIIYSSSDIAIKYAYPQPSSEAVLIFFTTCLMMIIFIKHIEPLKEILSNKKLRRRNKDEQV